MTTVLTRLRTCNAEIACRGPLDSTESRFTTQWSKLEMARSVASELMSGREDHDRYLCECPDKETWLEVEAGSTSSAGGFTCASLAEPIKVVAATGALFGFFLNANLGFAELVVCSSPRVFSVELRNWVRVIRQVRSPVRVAHSLVLSLVIRRQKS